MSQNNGRPTMLSEKDRFALSLNVRVGKIGCSSHSKRFRMMKSTNRHLAVEL